MTDILHIYTRVSTQAQQDEGTSLVTQGELGIQKAQELGFGHKVWNEGGQSSAEDDLRNRPVLCELLAEIDKKHVKHLFVFNTDRLSRNDSVWYLIKFKLITNGVTLYTCTGIYALTDPMNKLLLGILSEISSYDNSLRAERSRLGKLNKVRQGCWMGGPPPFGYRIEDKRLVENQDESKWVQFIYESYVSKKTLRWIRTQLINNDVKTRRNKNPWTIGSVESVLRNTHYAGYYHYKDRKTGELLRTSCDPLISYTLFKEVNEEIQRRSAQKRVMEPREKAPYLLKNYLICSHCGSGLSVKTNTKQNRSVYYCPRIERNIRNEHTNKVISCDNRRYLKIEETDDLIWNVVMKAISDTESIKMSLDNDFHEESGNRYQDLTKDKIMQLDIDIKECTKSIIELEANKIINKRTQDETEQIILRVEKARIDMEAERESLINNLEICRKKEGFLSYIAGMKESLFENQGLTLEDKRNILSNVIESIQVRTVDKQVHELTVNFHLAYATDSNYEKVLEKRSSAWRSHCDTHGTGDTSGASQTLTSGNYSKCISSLWSSLPITNRFQGLSCNFKAVVTTRSLSINRISDAHDHRLQLINELFTKGYSDTGIALFLNNLGIMSQRGRHYYPKLVNSTRKKFDIRNVRMSDYRIQFLDYQWDMAV